MRIGMVLDGTATERDESGEPIGRELFTVMYAAAMRRGDPKDGGERPTKESLRLDRQIKSALDAISRPVGDKRADQPFDMRERELLPQAVELVMDHAARQKLVEYVSAVRLPAQIVDAQVEAIDRLEAAQEKKAVKLVEPAEVQAS